MKMLSMEAHCDCTVPYLETPDLQQTINSTCLLDEVCHDINARLSAKLFKENAEEFVKSDISMVVRWGKKKKNHDRILKSTAA